MDGLEIVRGLMARGYSAHQAAALAGHALQESGGSPTALNKDEGANGILQWRGSRWDDLQNFAKSQGKSPYDVETQLDFVGKELNGSEKKAGSAFLAAPDVASASAALKPFIRYGDNSDAARLGNAQGLFSQIGGAPVGELAAAPAAASLGAAAAPVGALGTAAAAPDAAAPPTLAGGLGSLGKTLTGSAPEFEAVQPLQAARANPGQSQQIAAALAKAYGFGA